jgi:2-keto-3-deoxy-L-rhamnonate aldolase RhmA
MLELMYITNRVDVAQMAQDAGVDRIWIDMEYIGKAERQKRLNTVKNHHKVDDVIRLRPFITTSKLQARVNPIHDGSKEEINSVIAAGADIIMLPMFRGADEVRQFVDIVDGRVCTVLLLETKEAAENIDKILAVAGVDEMHIGINDLGISLGKTFMFETVTDGTVETLCQRIAQKGLPYGFGGIARLGFGNVPAEHIIAEHYRVGSTRAILSRSFCDANRLPMTSDVREIFIRSLETIRDYEQYLEQCPPAYFEKNRQHLKLLVDDVVKDIKNIKDSQ